MEWTEALDALERGADQCDQFFLGGRAGTPPELLDIPSGLGGLGPLPEQLSARARAVLRRIDSVHAQLARVPRPPTDAGRTHFAGASPAQPVTVDRTL